MKFQRNSLHKPLWATFLMLTIVIFMGISCVSAADLAIDNYKEVSPDATLITYKDSGFGEDTILAELNEYPSFIPNWIGLSKGVGNMSKKFF